MRCGFSVKRVFFSDLVDARDTDLGKKARMKMARNKTVFLRLVSKGI
jgi:hypothetical protein